MKNATYDKLRFLAEIGFPAAVTLILAVTQIWGLPYGQQIGATVAAIGTFVGAFVGVSRNAYNNTESTAEE